MVNSTMVLLTLICGIGMMIVNDSSEVSDGRCLFERLHPEAVRNVEREFGLIGGGSGHDTLDHMKVPYLCFTCYREVTDQGAEELIVRVYQRVIGFFDPPKHPLEIPVEGILTKEGRPYAKIMIGFNGPDHSERLAPHPDMVRVSTIGTVTICQSHGPYSPLEDVSETGLPELFERYGLPKGP